MSSVAKHELRSHKTYQTPMHKSNVVFRQNGLFPRHSEKNKNRGHWPSLEARFGHFKNRDVLAERIAESYKKKGAKHE